MATIVNYEEGITTIKNRNKMYSFSGKEKFPSGVSKIIKENLKTSFRNWLKIIHKL